MVSLIDLDSPARAFFIDSQTSAPVMRESQNWHNMLAKRVDKAHGRLLVLNTGVIGPPGAQRRLQSDGWLPRALSATLQTARFVSASAWESLRLQVPSKLKGIDDWAGTPALLWPSREAYERDARPLIERITRWRADTDDSREQHS